MLALVVTLAAATVLAVDGPAAATVTPPICGPGGGAGDFNGDNIADLAIGVSGEANATGAVDVTYGSVDGPGASSQLDQHWTLASDGVPGDNHIGNELGSALVAGDFNGDGYDDLAAGAPQAMVGAFTGAGQVLVLYGSRDRLTATGSQLLTQNMNGLAPGAAQTGDEFGHALAAGDFNADGYDDLAVGAPGDDGGAGTVQVIPGSAAGLSVIGYRTWSQDSGSMESSRESGDHFGWALATGRFDDDRYTDLAVGVPDEDDDEFRDMGAVHVIYSSPGGLTDAGNKLWHADLAGMPGDAETGDHLGRSLAAGNFNGDDTCDLAAGVPGESVVTSSGRSYPAAGAVLVLYSDSGGLSPFADAAPQYWTRNTTGIEGDPVDSAQFGYSLAAGDINGDGYWDLAIGAPFDDVTGHDEAGTVSVIYGWYVDVGLATVLKVPVWSQDYADSTGAVAGVAGKDHHFGSAMTMGNFNYAQGTNKDLAVSAPGDSGKGAVMVLYEWNNKLQVEPPAFGTIRITRYGTWGTAQAGDLFGESLS
ncbi:hypothetical protein GCM10020218_008440 [Dactylosporangium vinaceum]